MRVFVDIKDLSENNLREVFRELVPLQLGFDGNPLSGNARLFLQSLGNGAIYYFFLLISLSSSPYFGQDIFIR